MDRKSRSKSKDVKHKVHLACTENCANRPEIGCRTVTTNKYRDFSKYFPREEKEDSTNPVQIEQVYFGWLAKKRTDVFWYAKFLSDKKKFRPVFQMIQEDQTSNLQYPSKNFTKIIPLGTLDSGYIVRYKNPWDFHVVLEQQPLFWGEEGQQHGNMEIWKEYFKGDKMNFDSGVDLLRGLTALLSMYMEFLHEDPEWHVRSDGEDARYKRGDLVICVVPRKDDYDKSQTIMLGYRAVVVENNLQVMTQRGNKDVEGICMRLYLLDTGENRLVEHNSGFVAPLPEVFSVFRPLAIQCALHGISPVGVDWSSKACLEMKRMTLGGQLASPLVIEFYASTKAKEKVDSEGVKSEETSFPWDVPTNFVELTANVEDHRGPSAKRDEDLREIELVSLDTSMEEGKRVNVTTEMAIENLGLQWNLFPDRPEVYPHYFDLKLKPVDDAFEDYAFLQGNQHWDPLYARRVHEKLERGDMLSIYTEHYKKTPIKIKEDEKVQGQINVAFILNEDLESQVMTVRKDITDKIEEVGEEDENDIDVGNNVLSTMFNLDIDEKPVGKN